MEFPKNLLYTKDHEWAEVDASSSTVKIGITAHAQDALGDIVFVELPKVGRQLKSHETFGVVESIKAVSDLYSPISGEVIETNSDAGSDPSLINSAPYSDGWLIKLRLSDKASLNDLMKPEAYEQYVKSLK